MGEGSGRERFGDAAEDDYERASKEKGTMKIRATCPECTERTLVFELHSDYTNEYYVGLLLEKECNCEITTSEIDMAAELLDYSDMMDAANAYAEWE